MFYLKCNICLRSLNGTKARGAAQAAPFTGVSQAADGSKEYKELDKDYHVCYVCLGEIEKLTGGSSLPKNKK
jgi:hypothetical protein